MAKIKVIVRDKYTLVLEQDAKSGDIIDLKELNSIDISEIEKLIIEKKDELYQAKLNEMEEKLKLQFENEKREQENLSLQHFHDEESKLNKQINQLENELKIKQLEYEKLLSEKIQEERTKLNNEQIELQTQISILEESKKELETQTEKRIEEQVNLQISQFEMKKMLEIQQLQNEIEKLNNDHQNALELEKKNSEIKITEEIRKKEEEFRKIIFEKQELINTLQRQKSALNVKQTGEDLEAWCDNEMKSYLQTGFLNCIWYKDTKNVKNENETKGTKADFILKIFLNEDHLEEEIITSVCLEMKDENPESKNKKKNSDYFKQLDENRQKKNCKIALLVSNLEREKTNDLPIMKVSEYNDMYVVRPEYMMTFLNMVVSLTNIFSKIVIGNKIAEIQFKKSNQILKDFDDLKKKYLDKPLESMSNKITEIIKSTEIIEKEVTKIKDNAQTILDKSIEDMKNKIKKFSVEMEKKVTNKINSEE